MQVVRGSHAGADRARKVSLREKRLLTLRGSSMRAGHWTKSLLWLKQNTLAAKGLQLGTDQNQRWQPAATVLCLKGAEADASAAINYPARGQCF